MNTAIQAYHVPHTLDEAVRILAGYGGKARVIGGGTDYFVDDSKGDHAGGLEALIDVTQIAGFDDVHDDDGYVVIGCGATHAQIVASAAIQRGGTALMESCGLIGGPQVRNVGTLMGNIAHALPAADGTLALLALGGEIAVASDRGDGAATIEWLPLPSAFAGPGKSAIDSTRMIISAARFRPTGSGEGSAFARVMRPQGVALPIMGLACRVRMADGVFERAAIAAGPVAPTPFRAAKTEAYLIGKLPTRETVAAAGAVMLGEVTLRTSAHRATAEYRREVLPTLLRDALKRAVDRAQLKES